MVLDRQDVHAEVVAQQELVDDLLEQVGGDTRVAIAVGERAAHRLGRRQYLPRHVRVGNFALPPRIHYSRLARCRVLLSQNHPTSRQRKLSPARKGMTALSPAPMR